MRSLRLVTALGISLLPVALTGPGPAAAGGGAGFTVTASMEGQDQSLLAGSLHTVHITATDTPGEASLRQISVSVLDPDDPVAYPVVCDARLNGDMSLEPQGSLHCTTQIAAGPGLRIVNITANAYVPGQQRPLVRSRQLHYIGVMPPPPPTITRAADAHGLTSTQQDPAVSVPQQQIASHRLSPTTAPRPAAPLLPIAVAPEAASNASPRTSPTDSPHQASSHGSHGLAQTGTVVSVLGVLGLAVTAFGALLVRTVRRSVR